MNPIGFLLVGIGATLGAWLRWWFGTVLNPIFPTLPFGTLAANLAGGYLIGVAITLFAQHPGLPPEARLFAITGFLGAFTTFSTFSAEVVSLATRGQYGWAAGAAAAHLAGSLLMTLLGIASVGLLKS
ncbi:fluoride ion transporter CrcB [Thioalkalivibrio denitrificans]|uniref:Fluoride-specific ion channel FluC n=1 Tax=Thioalkalivibrio denitrificans TaxID=108003 RepID=A0A1V3NUN9_9GAMM|nr:fluoride efflux transporter CrcB [Thioalkalivibrio denitrificans]OOG28849.1 fluoride ion transporter CrcB [Thioalkalivibrio denitrificans]